MSNTRLTIVVRRDLQMPIGLFGAQCAHIADILRPKLEDHPSADIAELREMNLGEFFSHSYIEWDMEPYLSVLAVETREDLQRVIDEAKLASLSFNVWRDTVPSPTFIGDVISDCMVGVALGPDDFDKIKSVTARLKPY